MDMLSGSMWKQRGSTAARHDAVFDEFPVFYFTNPRTIQGPGAVYCQPDHFSKLDFELEAAIVIGAQGKNIPAAGAEAHIAGLMVMNDFSARTLQMAEMQLNLGPAKGKDFATATGPMLVTLDELADTVVPCKPGTYRPCVESFHEGICEWRAGERRPVIGYGLDLCRNYCAGLLWCNPLSR